MSVITATKKMQKTHKQTEKKDGNLSQAAAAAKSSLFVAGEQRAPVNKEGVLNEQAHLAPDPFSRREGRVDKGIAEDSKERQLTTDGSSSSVHSLFAAHSPLPSAPDLSFVEEHEPGCEPSLLLPSAPRRPSVQQASLFSEGAHEMASPVEHERASFAVNPPAVNPHVAQLENLSRGQSPVLAAALEPLKNQPALFVPQVPLTDIQGCRKAYSKIIARAVVCINNSARAKSSDLIPCIIDRIQRNWNKLNIGHQMLEDEAAQLQKLGIAGLTDHTACLNFLNGVYYLAQHQQAFIRAWRPFKKNTQSINTLLKGIGYVKNLDIPLTNGRSVKYFGFVKNGYRDGFGIGIYDNGYYQGNWNKGSESGHGVYTFAYGDRYEGNFEKGFESGHGVYTYANGNRYEGNFEKGLRNGHGVVTSADGERYEGNWEKGQANGHGMFTLADGERYEGNFEKGFKSGHGALNYANGDHYEGNFERGKPNGHGVLTHANGERYEGNFEKGERTGHGVHTHANGERYEGNFEKGERTGHGVHTHANGERYEGNFEKGERTGHGVHTFANGNRYEGSWKEGERTGHGILVSRDGKTQQGLWFEGEFLDPIEKLNFIEERKTLAANQEKMKGSQKKLKKNQEDFLKLGRPAVG